MTASQASGRRIFEFPTLLFLFFFSGASSLVYQVIWLRMLTRVFGATTLAVASLLTAFMAGLACGSWLSGRLLAHRGRALLLFGYFEIGIGLCAIALRAALPAAERAFVGALGGLDSSPRGEAFLRLALSLALLLLPTTLMGATLPLLAEHAVVRLSHLGSRIGALYALNTFGAMAGCFLAGFYAIGHLGLWGTTRLAVITNFAVGLTALALGRDSRTESEPPPDAALPGAPLYDERRLRWVVAGFALSGFCALGLEVVWTRLMTLVFIGYTYSFSIMLTVLLAGIATGSLVAATLADRSPDPLRLFGQLEIAIAVAVLATAPWFVRAEAWVRALFPHLGGGWAGQAAAQFAVGFLILFLPTFLFGATFPVVSRVAGRSLDRVGRTVGHLYSANVAGGTLGSFAAGFLLLPGLGSEATLRLLACALLLLGIGLVAASPASTPRLRSANALGGGLLAFAAVAVSPADLSLAIHRAWLREGESMTFYREAAEGTVMVGERITPDVGLDKRILISGSSASNSNYFGLRVNRIQGVLPFLFERAPRRVLGICFGTGVTFGTAAELAEHLDGVEIIPDVIRAAPRFAAENYEVAASPRVRIHIDDGRNFLLKTRERYDAVTMEPMPPALAGVVDLYTRDFYSLCRSRLAPGGLVSQWVPLYYLGPDDVRMLYRTFAESFPHALVFVSNFDTFLVGSDEPLRLSRRGFEERVRSPRLQHDLELLGLRRPDQMLGTFLLGREAMLRFAGGAPVLTDDLPYVEFTSPKYASLDSARSNLHALTLHAGYAADHLEAEEGAAASAFRTALAEEEQRTREIWRQAFGP